MACDLEQLFGALAARLPTDPGAEDVPFVLSSDQVASCPSSIRSDRIVARGTAHDYGGLLVDNVDLSFASHAVCRQFGLFVLSCLFHPDPETVELQLSNPASTIQRIRIRFAHPTREQALLYWAVPTFVPFAPGQAERHPTPLETIEDQPHLELTDADESGHRWQTNRDTVVGFGNDRAMAWLAGILIDAGSEAADVPEINFESFAGFGGVSRHSAELRLWLPGSDFWNAADFGPALPPL